MSDLISRADAIEAVCDKCPISFKEKCEWKDNGHCSMKVALDALPSADAVDCTDFIEWLVEVVMDDEDWELNAVAYGEIICRKLVKLGVLEVTEEPSYYIRPSANVIKFDFNKYQPRVRNKVNDGTLLVEAVQGEWVDEDGNNVPLHKDGYPLRSCYCNQCHEWLVASDEYEVKGNFCPNCGARMKGGAE